MQAGRVVVSGWQTARAGEVLADAGEIVLIAGRGTTQRSPTAARVLNGRT